MALPGFRKNIKDYYQAFDLFVCPSRREPLPLVMLEAFDAGFRRARPTASELIEEYGGDLFPIGEVAALAALLRSHASAPRKRQTHDLTPHFIASVNQTIMEVYAKLIARRRQQC
jgi:glycosyltransferase involved in cell wall biosynthesis